MQAVARLYKQLQPKSYSLSLFIDTKKLTLKGKCTINAKVSQKGQKTILLHAKDLDILSLKVNDIKCQYKYIEDVIEIDTSQANIERDVCIIIEYKLNITKAMHGVYQSYTADGGLIISTQFESHHAREAFPCIDEPEAKATFDIQITTPRGTTLSNMPALETKKTQDNYITTTFVRTPIMSPYLVAFVWGDLQRVSTTTSDGTEVSVWSSKDHSIEDLVFPLEVSVKALEFLNDYFGMPYPLPKCDHVAIPDFSSGAMENWGLITYREIALLANPETISTAQKEQIALVIAHELSHQWFGNLVTMKWWDDLWLNESFANLMEYLIIEAIYPEWNVLSSFTDSEALMAFRRDILPGVQAVKTDVTHPDQISALFDPSIVYAKGSRLLWMAYNYVGDKAFKNALKEYFTHNAYKNTTGKDLWDALSISSNKDIALLMKPWVEQSGFPYVELSEDNHKIVVKQNQLSTEPPKDNKIWPIPLWPTAHKNIVLNNKSAVLNWEGPIRLNKIGGHYVCHYKREIDKKNIINSLINNDLNEDSRLLLLSDSALLAKCHVSSLAETLDLLINYSNEQKEPVWGIISMIVGDLRMITEDNKATEIQIKKLVWKLVRSQYKRLGLNLKNSDSLNDKKLRSVIIGLAAYTEEKQVIKDILNFYNNFNDIESIPADIRGSVLSVALKHKKPSTFDKLIIAYPVSSTSSIKRDIAYALCNSKNTKEVSSLLGKIKDDKFVRKQDLDLFIVLLLRNRYSRKLAWEWLKNNWKWISETFASDKSYDMYPRYVAGAFSNKNELDQYLGLFEPLKSEPALSRNIEIGIKEIENKIAWRNLDLVNITNWLKAQ